MSEVGGAAGTAAAATAASDDEDDEKEEAVLNRSAEVDEEDALARALSLPRLLTSPSLLAPSSVTGAQADAAEPPGPLVLPLHVWPAVFDEETILSQQGGASWPDLSGDESTYGAAQRWVRQNGKLLIRTVTWNLAAQPPPAASTTMVTYGSDERRIVSAIGKSRPECTITVSRYGLSTLDDAVDVAMAGLSCGRGNLSRICKVSARTGFEFYTNQNLRAC